jgi:predicted Fe-S protein YdhL (DUF1289 family)
MTVESPCIRLCQLDASGTLCLGCHRTLYEIATWSGMTDAQRQATLEAARHRAARPDLPS